MNPSTALATVLVDELVQHGVRHAVLCPGSRSAPLAYALHEAERAGRITLHVRVDERSAGFLALGLGKLTRTPAVVVTTSGTAVANLHPAVLEAHHGVVPLVVVSADRPVELRGTGANQTTVQPGIFAEAVRWSCDAPAPGRGVGEVARWRALAASAFDHATGAAAPGSEPGPVHVNLQLREPLVPTEGEPWPEPLGAQESADPRESASRADAAHRPVAHRSAVSGANIPIVEDVARTLVLIGDLPEPDQFDRAVRWARSHGWPVLAEPFGTHPRQGVTPHGPLVLSDAGWLDEHAPDRVVAVGRLTLSRPVAALLRRPGVRVEAVAAHAWIESRPDIHAVHPTSVLDDLGPTSDPRVGGDDHRTNGAEARDPAWTLAWHEAGDRLASALSATDLPWPSGLSVARLLVASLPADSTLFLGSSNSARDVDVAATPRAARLRVVASRGLAGIDGCVSTAVGLALSSNSPTYALMGDLTFLHDANGLLIGPLERQPDLTVVVANDDGGGIFTLLEPGEPERDADFERLFGTPTGTDLAALCAAHGVRHQQVRTAEHLVNALGDQPSGLTVLEVAVDRGRHRELHAQLRARAAAALKP